MAARGRGAVCGGDSCAARLYGPAPVAAAVLALGKGPMQQDHLRRPPNSRTGQVPASVRPPAPRRPWAKLTPFQRAQGWAKVLRPAGHRRGPSRCRRRQPRACGLVPLAPSRCFPICHRLVTDIAFQTGAHPCCVCGRPHYYPCASRPARAAARGPMPRCRGWAAWGHVVARLRQFGHARRCRARRPCPRARLPAPG